MKATALIFALVTAFPVAAAATTCLVAPDGGGDYPTIQSAIDAGCDSILLADGVFEGLGNRDLDFGGLSIVVRSVSGDPSSCVLDCDAGSGDPHRGFSFQNGESADAVVEGVSITNGWSYVGGAVFCYGASPTFISCDFISNGCDDEGGAIFCDWSSAPAFIDCRIADNQAEHRGGGIRVAHFSAPQLIGCEIVGNRAVGQHGGGIYSSQNSSPAMIDCLITGNVAGLAGGGIAISCVDDCEPELVGCTITANVAEYGGGITSQVVTTLSIERSIIWGNCASTMGDEIYLPGVAEEGIAFTCCAVDSHGVIGDAPTEYITHNVFTNPYFCGPEPCEAAPTTDGDYSLGANSPCLAESSPCGEQIGALGQGCGVVGVAGSNVDPDAVPLVAALLSASPNPFHRTLEVRFAASSPPSIAIFDVRGRRVRSLTPDDATGMVRWDGRTDDHRLVAPGVYFVRLESVTGPITRRISLVR